MFNKSKSPAPSPAKAAPQTAASGLAPLPDLPATPSAPRPAAPPTPQRGLSMLAADLQFSGDVTGAGDLQIDGQVKGDVRVGRLIVGETGAVEGNVQADYIEVRGRIVGAVGGKQVKLVSTAYVDGDITAEQLSIDIGAYFQGRVLQGRREAPAAAPQPRPTPAPQPAQPQMAQPAQSQPQPIQPISMVPHQA